MSVIEQVRLRHSTGAVPLYSLWPHRQGEKELKSETMTHKQLLLCFHSHQVGKDAWIKAPVRGVRVTVVALKSSRAPVRPSSPHLTSGWGLNVSFVWNKATQSKTSCCSRSILLNPELSCAPEAVCTNMLTVTHSETSGGCLWATCAKHCCLHQSCSHCKSSLISTRQVVFKKFEYHWWPKISTKPFVFCQTFH